MGTEIIGKAKVQNVDTNGDELFTTSNPGHMQLSGSILAQDPATGDPVELTAIQDTSGNWVLRTVKAAEVAYNSDLDNFKYINDGWRNGTIIGAQTITASTYVGSVNHTVLNTAEVYDITPYRRVGLVVKNTDTANTATLGQIVITTQKTGTSAPDQATGKEREVWALSGVTVGPGATKYFIVDELISAGVASNSIEGRADFVSLFKGGIAARVTFTATDGACSVAFIGGE